MIPPTRSDPTVTAKVETIMGRIPYMSLFGNHVVPNRNLKKPISANAGTAETNIYRTMATTAITEKKAETIKMIFAVFSLLLSDFIIASISSRFD